MSNIEKESMIFTSLGTTPNGLMPIIDFIRDFRENEKMKNIDFNKRLISRHKKLKKGSPQNTWTQPENEKSAIVIPFHAMLKNELKLYRGTSTSNRLGVLRKYDELIAMARKN
jgi:hypothetical protein